MSLAVNNLINNSLNDFLTSKDTRESSGWSLASKVSCAALVILGTLSIRSSKKYLNNPNNFLESIRSISKMRLLLALGVDVNKQNDCGDTALIEASRFGRVDGVKLLLEVNGIDVNIQNIDGDTALIAAIKNDNLEVVQTLLTVDKLDVNIKNTKGLDASAVAKDYLNRYVLYWRTIQIIEALYNHQKKSLENRLSKEVPTLTKCLLPIISDYAIDEYKP